MGEHPPGGEADRDAARRDRDELRPDPGDRAGAARRPRASAILYAVSAGAVVDQRLALEDRLRAAGDAEAVEHGGGRHRVGRPEHRAEHERRRPRDAEHRVGDRGDGGDRHQDEPDREQARSAPSWPAARGRRPRSPPRTAAAAGRRRRRCPGSSSRRRQARHEADDQPAEHERDRVGHAGAQPEARQDGDGEQQEDEELDVAHGIIYPPVPCLVDARGLRCPMPLDPRPSGAGRAGARRDARGARHGPRGADRSRRAGRRRGPRVRAVQ